MSKYTMTVRQLQEIQFDFGLKDYPIFDESYRPSLNKKILDHFYMREIGAETPGLFAFYLNRTMREIMPYYNQLYNSEIKLSGVDVFESLLITENYSETENTESSGETNSVVNNTVITDGKSENQTVNESTTKNQENDTPMGSLNDIYATDYATRVNQESTNSNDTVTESTNATQTNNGTANSKDSTSTDRGRDYSKTTKGKSDNKTYPELIMELRKAFLNIDMMVIRDLEPCFMQLW